MMQATVEEAAEAFGVTPKSIREWIRDGLPTIKDGAKGPGRGAIVDMARVPAWYMRTHRGGYWQIAEGFAEKYPGRNPLRDILDIARLGTLSCLARALRSWADHPEDLDSLDHRRAGISDKQARAVAYQLWMVCLLAIDAYHRRKLEEDIKESVGGDLDALFSFLTCGDFRTPAKHSDSPMPQEILELMPADIRRQVRRRRAARGRRR